jgi:hypothetical protein
MVPNDNNNNNLKDRHDHLSLLHLLLPRTDRLNRKHKDRTEGLDLIPTHPNLLLIPVKPIT